MAAKSRKRYEETTADIEETLGIVPGFMGALPEQTLINEWPTFKQLTVEESEIPPKYRELMGLAVAANLKCPYCQAFHREAAKLNGATDEELNEVAAVAGHTAQWSSIIHAQNYDLDKFGEELSQIGAHLVEQSAD